MTLGEPDRQPVGGAFGELLAALRCARGLSQERLAELTGVSARAIGDLERGATRRPQRQTVVALADGLRLDAGERDRLARAARPAADRSGPAAGDGGLVGRARELAGLVDLLDDGGVRMASVLGPAGIGKSALAVAALARVRSGTSVGVVRRGSLMDGADPVEAIAGAATAGGRRLVLVDDADLIPGQDLAALLARDAGLRLLVTARTPVRVRAEHRWPIGPLDQPAAVDLLARRARAVRPGIDVDEDAVAAASVVRRLGGNPMAIELTAARLRTWRLSDVDAALAVELAGARDEVLHRVVRSAVGRLPGPDAECLTVLASLGRAAPHELRRALAARRYTTDHLDATVTLLAATALISVSGPRIEFTVPRSVREVVCRQPVPVGIEERTSLWNWPPF
jgi:transcriptional regulator with XRE-family HTH domain